MTSVRLLAAWSVLCFALLDEPLLYRDEVDPHPERFAMFLLGLGLFFVAGKGRPGSEPLDARHRPEVGVPPSLAWLCVLGLLVASDLPGRIGFAACALGALLGIGEASAMRARAARSLLAAGLGAVLVCALGTLLPPLLVRAPELGFLSPLVSSAMNALGIPTLVSETGEILLLRGGARWPFSVTAEKLALVPAALFLAVAVATGPRSVGPKVPRVVGTACLVGAYLLLRLVVLAGYSSDAGHVRAFVDPWWVLASLLPLVAIGRPWPSALETPRPRKSPLLLCGAVAALVAAVRLEDPGERKPGRILIDEAHSEWEWTDEPLDKVTYGERTTYNYRSMFDYLSRHFPAVDRNEEALTPDVLSGYDVVILKTPTLTYGVDELDALQAFVRSGGGIWMIGDHTDVFGTASCLNQLGAALGIQFVADSLDDAGQEGRQVYHPPTRGRDPINQHLPSFLMATSASLELDWRASTSMTADTVWSDRADYQVPNFFGNHELDGNERFGMRSQAARAFHGRGRVAAYADSTTLSSFSFFLPGNAELCLATVEWLNRSNGSAWFWWLRVGAVGLAVVLLRAWQKSRPTESPRGGAVLAVAGGLFSGLWTVDAMNVRTYPLPDVIRPPTKVAFELGHGSALLPLDHEAHDWDPNNYVTFFVWTQRVGLVPRVVESLHELPEHAAAVIVEPEHTFDEAELDVVDEFLSAGGKLLVMASSVAGTRSPNGLLSRYGLRLRERLEQPSIVLSDVGAEGDALRVQQALIVEGGEPFLFSRDGEALASRVEVGGGTLVAVGFARAFSVDSLGMPIETPTRAQRALGRIEFHLFEQALGLGGPSR